MTVVFFGGVDPGPVLDKDFLQAWNTALSNTLSSQANTPFVTDVL